MTITKNTISIIVFVFSMLASAVTGAAVTAKNGPHELAFKGYFRVGEGVSEGDTSQARYILPGARAKYRLGNEPETNVELTLKYAYKPLGEDKKIELVAMRDGFANHGTDFKLDHWAQAYFSLHDVMGEGDFWFGRRYYDRKSIHLMNHYWLNPGQNSHLGGGVEGMKLPVGSLDIAWFEYHDKGAADLINSHAIDFRWRDIDVDDDSSLTLWAQLSRRDANAVLAYADRDGAAIGWWLDSKIDQMKNTLSFTMQSGASITQGDFRPEPVREDQQWDLHSAYVYEFNNALFYEVLPDFAVQWSGVFRHEDRGLSGPSKIDWLSTGVRPIIFLSDHMSLAFEFGLDYIDDKLNDRSGRLLKETVALQIAPARGFYKRPVLRLFATAAQWGDDFQGLVGHAPDDAPYGAETEGWSLGVQLEWWW